MVLSGFGGLADARGDSDSARPQHSAASGVLTSSLASRANNITSYSAEWAWGWVGDALSPSRGASWESGWTPCPLCFSNIHTYIHVAGQARFPFP